MGPVDYGAKGAGFPFGVGDKIVSSNWPNPSASDHITITAIGNHRFLAEWPDGTEVVGYRSARWSPWVVRREVTVSVERRHPRKGECFITPAFRTVTYAAYDFDPFDVRDVIVGVKS